MRSKQHNNQSHIQQTSNTVMEEFLAFCTNLKDFYTEYCAAEVENDRYNIRTAKNPREPYEMPAPDFCLQANKDNYKQLLEQYYESYEPPVGKVLLNFSKFFTTYAWP